MAITPRTILSRPLNLLVFILGVLGVGGIIGLGISSDSSECDAWKRSAPSEASQDLDAGTPKESVDASSTQWGEEHSAAPGFNLDYTCQLERPSSDWSEEQWLRHFDCMQARGASDEALLEKTEAAIDSLGLTHELAISKADLLAKVADSAEHRAFLEDAVNQIGVMDGRLVHRLSRALAWNVEREDIERIRHLQLLSRTLREGDCEVAQTDIWVRYLMAERLAEKPSPAADQRVGDAVDAYLDGGCHEQRHSGQWDALAEVVGVGLAAERTNGHDAHSLLIRQIAEAYRIHRVDAFCEQAVPEHGDLRAYCEKRVGDELFLSQR